MNLTSEEKELLKTIFSSRCNKLCNGFCSTAACLYRGGYVPGSNQKVSYDIATCLELEVYNKLKEAGYVD